MAVIICEHVTTGKHNPEEGEKTTAIIGLLPHLSHVIFGPYDTVREAETHLREFGAEDVGGCSSVVGNFRHECEEDYEGPIFRKEERIFAILPIALAGKTISPKSAARVVPQ